MIKLSTAEINRHLIHWVHQVKSLKLIQSIVIALFIAVSAYIIFDRFNFTLSVQLLITIIIFFVILLGQINFEKINKINVQVLLEHINRNNSLYQESAQLLVKEDNKLTILQMLQKNKVIAVFSKEYENNQLKKYWFNIRYKRLAITFVSCVMITFISQVLIDFLNSHQMNQTVNQIIDENSLSQPIKLIKSTIKITPPSYTKLNSTITNDLNLKIIENSKVEWHLSFSDNSLDYFFISDGNTQEKLIKNREGSFVFSKTIKQTGVYRIISRKQQTIKKLSGIYSIEISLDKQPKIRIIQPHQTLVEIPKNETPTFAIVAAISDDFGLNKVEIIASVAKGSGEAVKFRDEVFEFEKYIEKNSTREYSKHWSLIDLKMEPGDEVYFSIHATDNKKPTPQKTKSSSMIVRWLDDEPTEIAAEGMRIHFVPEYFRSQRQVIVETEQLIADQVDLKFEDFKNKSEELGYSQSDLKQKYGQYLGDEFGEGASEQFGLADGYHGGEDMASGEANAGVHNKEHHEKEHHEKDLTIANKKQSHNHEGSNHEHHQVDDGNVEQQSIDNSKQQLVAQFTHNHNEEEVAPLSKQDPKSWMKKAVSVMWQAELHLMLSEPEKALPYEYEAYQYLKLARQADRIYVKRLGFEPPPVNENKRLTGELKGIVSYQKNIIDQPKSNTDQLIYQKTYWLLSSWSQNKIFDHHAKAAFFQLKQNLLKLAKTRPALIHYAATVENIIVTENLNLLDCRNCILKLKNKLWQLMSNSTSLPYITLHQAEANHEQMQHYMNAVEKLKRSNNKNHSKKNIKYQPND